MTSTDLSLNEQWLWLVEALTPGSIARSTATLGRRIRGPLDVERLRRCVTELVRRHETLRTTFVVEQGRLHREVSVDSTPEWIWRDFGAEPPDEREAQAMAFMDKERTRSFDLSQGKQTKCMVARISDDEHLMLFGTHHLAVDAASLVLLEEELSSLYASDATTLGLEPLPYTRFVEWQATDHRSSGDAAHAYWETMVEDAERLDLDLVFGPPVRPALAGYTMTVVPVGMEDRQQVQLDLRLSAKVRDLVRTSRCSLYMVLLAALEVLLYLRSRKSSFLVRTPSANRTRPEHRTMIGTLETHLFVKANIEPSGTFAKVLQEVRQQVMSGLRQHGVPMSLVLGSVLRRGIAASRGVALAGGAVQFALFTQGRMAPWPAPLDVIVSAGSRIGLASDLQVFAMEEGRRLDGAEPGIVLEANNPAGAYPAEAVAELLGAYRDVLAAVSADSEVTISALAELVPPADSLHARVEPESERRGNGGTSAGVTEAEQRLLGIARAACGDERITAADSLFPSPETAISTGVRLVEAINCSADRPGRKISIVDLLERPTVAGLAAQMIEGGTAVAPR